MIVEFTERGPVLVTLGVPDAQPCPGLEAGDVPIAWSLDGRALFFTRVRTRTVEIHRVEVSTGRQKLVRSLVIQDPAGVRTPMGVHITPDGKSLRVLVRTRSFRSLSRRRTEMTVTTSRAA